MRKRLNLQQVEYLLNNDHRVELLTPKPVSRTRKVSSLREESALAGAVAMVDTTIAWLWTAGNKSPPDGPKILKCGT